MLQLRQLNLKLAFARPGALREDVENQRCAIEHFALENLFQVAALRRRKFVVKDDRIDILAPALPLPMKVPAAGASSFCVPSPTTSAPAVTASSASSSSESRTSQLVRHFNSAPMRKTRSVLVSDVDMSAFNF